MAKDSLPKIVPQAKEQPPHGSATQGTRPSTMPGKMRGDKMPHEVMNDKMASKLCK